MGLYPYHYSYTDENRTGCLGGNLSSRGFDAHRFVLLRLSSQEETQFVWRPGLATQGKALINLSFSGEHVNVLQCCSPWNSTEVETHPVPAWGVLRLLSGTGKRAEGEPDLCSVPKRVQSLRRDKLRQEILLFVSVTGQTSHARINSCLLGTRTNNIAKEKKIKRSYFPRNGEKSLKVTRNCDRHDIRNFFLYNSVFILFYCVF